jgi:hypothetical protein
MASYFEAHDNLIRELTTQWGTSLKRLLEEKHLYQRVSFNGREISEKIYSSIAHASAPETKIGKDRFSNEAPAILEAPLVVYTEQSIITEIQSGIQELRPTLLLSNVKLFCSVCDRREAFVPVVFREISADRNGNRNPQFKHLQVFHLSFECQGCKGIPETFLIKREGFSLWLEGRSPFETVEVPAFIPKKEAKFFRDAMVAMHGGKPLAALFYLRTFLEQFARRVTGIIGRETGEKIMEAYGTSIPVDLRDRTPSLREWYDKLSEAVHGAKEDEALFEEARLAVEKHFEVRKVFNLPEQLPHSSAAKETSGA